MKKMISVLLCVAVSLTVLSENLFVAAAVYMTGDTYPQEYKTLEIDAVVDQWNFYNRECTSFVAWCLNSRNGVNFTNSYGGVHWGNANNWDDAARSIGIAVDNIPTIGAVAQSNGGSFGHVAWVSNVNGDTITIEDYNYHNTNEPRGIFHSRTVNKSSFQYIHIKDIVDPTVIHTHSYTSAVTKEPTCTEYGVKTFTCPCGDFYTETIEPLGHNYTEYIYEQMKLGYSGIFDYDYEGYKCCRCNDVYETKKIGKSGDCTWTLENGVLIISGIGKMADDNRNNLYRYGKDYRAGKPDFHKVIVQPGVTYIGIDAFADCPNLSSILISNSVEKIGENAFDGCTLIKTAGAVGNGCDYEFGWTQKIPDKAFCGCENLESVILPDGLEVIGNSAFENCRALKNIVVPDSVTAIGSRAFSSCVALTDFNFPTQLKTIGHNAYSQCTGLTRLILPYGLKEIDSDAFGWCSGLSKIIIPKTVTTLNAPFCESHSNFIKTIGPIGSGCDLEYGWDESLPNNAFAGFKNVQCIQIAEGITSLGICPFMATKVERLILPSTIKDLEGYLDSGVGFGMSYEYIHHIYYNGTKTQWDKIPNHNSYNISIISNAQLHFGTYESEYCSFDGSTVFRDDFLELDINKNNLSDGWYFEDADNDYNEPLIIDGDVKIVLKDGVTLTAEKGIVVEGNSTLTVYSQSLGNNMGKIIATGSGGDAGIGGSFCKNGGTVIINGCDIKAVGGIGAAGIGGGFGGNGGTCIINGGKVEAVGGFGNNSTIEAAGIGGGYAGECGTVTINNVQSLTATGGRALGTSLGLTQNLSGLTVSNKLSIRAGNSDEDSARVNQVGEEEYVYIIPTLVGDLNVDNKIDALDLTEMGTAILNNIKNQTVFDTNADGAFDIRDLVRLKKHLADNTVPLGKQNNSEQKNTPVSEIANLPENK